MADGGLVAAVVIESLLLVGIIGYYIYSRFISKPEKFGPIDGRPPRAMPGPQRGGYNQGPPRGNYNQGPPGGNYNQGPPGGNGYYNQYGGPPR